MKTMSIEQNESVSVQFKRHLNAAYIMRDAQMHADALNHTRAAIKLEPENAEPQNVLGMILADMGKQEEAIEAYGEALRLDPDFTVAQKNLTNVVLSHSQSEHEADQTIWAALIAAAFGALVGMGLGTQTSLFIPDRSGPGFLIGLAAGMIGGIVGFKTSRKMQFLDINHLGFWWRCGAYGGTFAGILYSVLFWDDRGIVDGTIQFFANVLGGGLIGGALYALVVGLVVLAVKSVFQWLTA